MRVLPKLILLLSLALAGGCSHPHAPLAIEVRDAVDHQPVADAQLRMRPLWFYVPDPKLNDLIVNPNAEPGVTAVTDGSGTAMLSAPVNQAFDLLVLVPGAAIQSRTIETHPDSIESGISPWLELTGASAPDTPGPRFEIRLRRPDHVDPIDAD